MAKKAESTEEYAEAVTAKIAEELKTLLFRNWKNIGRILTADGDIAIGAKIMINDRKATPGEHPEKDSRIKVSISFAEKYSDTIEGELPDPSQSEMDLQP
jgi:hypothetical protein